MDFDQARFNMVEQQIRPWDVLDPLVLTLFSEVPRHHFVLPEQAALAYSDYALPIGHQQTMLAPKVEARLLQGLGPCADEHALEIGTGSGFHTALLASACASVTTVEIHQDLQQRAQARLKDFDNITFALGDAHQSWHPEQTYDLILITGAVPSVPDSYLQQLSLGGRLAVISGHRPVMQAQIITRVSDQEWTYEGLFETEIDYLENAHPQPTFQF